MKSRRVCYGVGIMNIAIVDDDEKERYKIEHEVKSYISAHRLNIGCRVYSGGKAFLEDAEINPFFLVFMDIFMEDLDGIETVRQLKKTNEQTLVVFLTNSPDHWKDAFSFHAFDYLLKPVDRDALSRTLDDAFGALTADEKNFVFYAADKRHVSVPCREILWVTSDSNYLNMKTVREEFRLRMTFSHICNELAGESSFISINRGVLVNLAHVRSIEDCDCCMDDGTVLLIAQRKRAAVRQQYVDWKFDQKLKKMRRPRR